MKNNMLEKEALFRVVARSLTATFDAAKRLLLLLPEIFKALVLSGTLQIVNPFPLTQPGVNSSSHGGTGHGHPDHLHLPEEPQPTARRRDRMVLGLT